MKGWRLTEGDPSRRLQAKLASQSGTQVSEHADSPYAAASSRHSASKRSHTGPTASPKSYEGPTGTVDGPVWA